MSVQALAQVDPKQFFNLSSTNGAGTQRLDTKVSGLAVSNDFSGRLSVTTAEGDKITVSADFKSDFRAVNYKAHAEGDGKTVDAEANYAEYSLKQEFGVTVEGDLNQDEVKDLAKLFQKVSNIFKKYVSGQDDAALAKTAKLGDNFGNYSSLTDLSLNVDLERSVTVFAAELVGEVGSQPGTPAALPASMAPATTPEASTTHAATPGTVPSTAAVIPPPSPGITALTQAAASTPAPSTGIAGALQTTASEPSQPSSIVQQVLDATQDARVDPRKLNKYFLRFLKNLGEALRNGKQDGKQPEGTQANQTPTVPSQQGSAAFLAYQSIRQTSLSFSIRT
jgi:hypothetical protein